MEFRALTQEDVDYMAEHTGAPEYYEQGKKEAPKQNLYSYALVHEGETLCVGGFTLMNQHTCVNWIDISAAGRKKINQVWRTVKEWTEGYNDSSGAWCPGFYEQMGIVRAESYVRSDFPAGIRFVEHFDFAFEHRAMKYFGDCPADVYVKFFDWDKK
jgi:hypothetical protein